MANHKSSNVPTMDEFNQLKDEVHVLQEQLTITQADVADLDDRVDMLETGGNTTPPIDPEPIPPNPNPTPGEGMQAKRVVTLCEMMGVNTFSSLDTNNSWGSWPANYSPPSVTKALRWIVGDSGYQLPIREYHYAGKYDMQKQWFDAILAEFPDTLITICPGANAGVADATSMVKLPHHWVEGLNEPNTDFGSGEVKFDVTKAIQDEAFAKGKPGTVMGPSIVAGTPHPEGWITGYCGSPENLASLNAKLNYGNGHYYPPGSPDVPNTGYSVNEYIGGLWGVYNKNPIFLTEYCSLLYNSQGHKDPDTEGVRSAYYTLNTTFRCAQNGTMGIWWYALFDYGTVYKCGLFPKDENNPRKDAYALRALCHICADTGDNRRSFNPGKLDYTVSGGDEATGHSLYQGSDGKFYITLWRSLANPGGQSIPVVVTAPGKLEEYDLMAHLDKISYAPKQRGNDSLPVQLDGGVRVIVVG